MLLSFSFCSAVHATRRHPLHKHLSCAPGFSPAHAILYSHISWANLTMRRQHCSTPGEAHTHATLRAASLQGKRTGSFRLAWMGRRGLFWHALWMKEDVGCVRRETSTMPHAVYSGMASQKGNMKEEEDFVKRHGDSRKNIKHTPSAEGRATRSRGRRNQKAGRRGHHTTPHLAQGGTAPCCVRQAQHRAANEQRRNSTLLARTDMWARTLRMPAHRCCLRKKKKKKKRRREGHSTGPCRQNMTCIDLRSPGIILEPCRLGAQDGRHGGWRMPLLKLPHAYKPALPACA